MSNMTTVIQGAYYYNESSDTILCPHFTGEFYVVDCTEYITEDEMKEKYDDAFIEEHKDDYREIDGERYYYAEYSPNNVGEWELLSDISGIHFSEDSYEFVR